MRQILSSIMQPSVSNYLTTDNLFNHIKESQSRERQQLLQVCELTKRTVGCSKQEEQIE
jgi:hypothetical protein